MNRLESDFPNGLQNSVVSTYLNHIFNYSDELKEKLLAFHSQRVHCDVQFDPLVLKEKFRRNNSCYGIDLPYWITPTTTKRKIMLVGMEPARKDNDNNRNHVTIATPWVLHSNYNKGTIPRIRNLVQLLKDQNSFVYVTDVSKVYYEKNKREDVPEIFKAELDLVKPNLIVFLGEARFRFNSFGIENSAQILSLPHPNIRKKGFGWKAINMYNQICANMGIAGFKNIYG